MGLGPLPFPVKLTTVIGSPIKYDVSHTPESLAAATKLAIEGLMSQHQPKGQTIVGAIQERIKK